MRVEDTSGVYGEPVRRRRRVRPTSANGDRDAARLAGANGDDDAGQSADLGGDADGPDRADSPGGPGARSDAGNPGGSRGELARGHGRPNDAGWGDTTRGDTTRGDTTWGDTAPGDTAREPGGSGDTGVGRSGPAAGAGASPHPAPGRAVATGRSTGGAPWAGTGHDARRHGRHPEPGAATAPITDETAPWVAEAPPVTDSLPAERGLRGLVGGGSSQISPTAAMRARDAARPRPEDLARAESDLTIVRRHWSPRE